MKVVLATPNFHQPRGNTITVQRISDGLKCLGHTTEIISITDTSISKLPEADIIHGFHAYHFYSFIQTLKEKPKSFMITLTGTDLNHYLVDKDTRSDVITCIKDARTIHVFNDEAKEILMKEVPEVKHKTVMIPQGASNFKDSSSSYKKEENTFLFVLPAGIRKVKNVPFALETVKKLHDQYPNIRLWIVGPILEEEEGQLVKELVNANKKWVSYLGQLAHEEMSGIYYQADCILNTSHSEGQSSAILEAMGYGIPVLVAGNEGNKSIVSDQETGFIYHNQNQFLDYAKKIMNNINLRQSISISAKQYIAEHHSSAHEVEYLLKLYQEILKNR
ncbi:glycosyltransferase family 4 protein [Aquibacillus saliphilus]|uniref:glycosyltransferase family 4 protein n=1 Tax=Aquibacillus saliphilus TaxID=1909422 RepID=UPI001CEFBC30|nr:glycosyltransferase family 4 protein [Aquibacillus saliphilus]